MSTPATSLQLNIETNEEIEELMEDEVAEDDPDRDNQVIYYFPFLNWYYCAPKTDLLSYHAFGFSRTIYL